MGDRAVTVITGTRKGIGRHLAQHYAERGHAVIGCSRGTPDWWLDGYEHVQADVSDEGAVGEVFERVRRHDRLDHLINNAGVARMNHSLLTPTSALATVLDTNVVGTFLFCREAARLMRRRRYGRIVNFSTVAVPMKLEGESVYAASKAAVEALTPIMAREFAPLGVTVNALGPALVETDLTAGVPQPKLDEILAKQAIHRAGTPEEVAHVTDFFLSEQSGYVTGQTLYMGGP